HNGPDGAADWVRVLACGIGDGIAKVIGNLRQRSTGRRRHGFEARGDKSSLTVLHGAELELVLEGVYKLDVANAARGALNLAGDTLVDLLSDAARPIDRGPNPYLLFPLSTYFGQVLHPNVSGAAAVGALDDYDFLIRQRGLGIEVLKPFV